MWGYLRKGAGFYRGAFERERAWEQVCVHTPPPLPLTMRGGLEERGAALPSGPGLERRAPRGEQRAHLGPPARRRRVQDRLARLFFWRGVRADSKKVGARSVHFDAIEYDFQK